MTLRQVVLIAMSVICLYPLYFLIITSLKTNNEYTTNPTGLPIMATLTNYVQAFRAIPMLDWFGNTFILALFSIVISTLISAFAAYAIAWGQFKGRKFLLQMNIALMVVPPVILILPLFTLNVKMGMANSLTSVIIFYAGLLIPFSVFLLTSFFKEVPEEVVTAAEIDGCTRMGVFWRIIVPLALPAFVTLMIVNCLWVWNELLIALVFLQEEHSRTIMAGLSLLKGRYSTNQPLMMAGAIVAIVPTVLMYLFGQKFFVKGLTAGMGK
jgi:ABC-type glycerol-3-phosphate transport system permease component